MGAGLIQMELFSVVAVSLIEKTLVTPLLLRLAFTQKETSHA